MPYLLFFGYLLLFCWLLTRMPFFNKSGIPVRHLVIYFLLKVVAGLAYGYIHYKQGGGDTWEYQQDSLRQMAQLRSDPSGFFTSIFMPGYSSGYGEFFGVRNSYWNDLDWIVITKSLALTNLLTGTQYYTNTLFYNFLCLAGPILLARVWKQVIPNAGKLLVYLPFLIPSFLFWTSGIHKEGLLVLATGLVVHSFYFGYHQQWFGWKRITAMVLGLLIVLVLRNFLLLPLVGALTGWVLAQRFIKRPLLVNLANYLLLCILFFSLRMVSPKLDFPQVVADRQAAFSRRTGSSEVTPLPLNGTTSSFIRSAPEALIRAGFRPLPTDIQDLRTGIAAAESMLVLGLLLLSVPAAFRSRWRNPFLLFCLFYSFAVLLSVGYTVNFLGAIVRYRSVVLPLMLMPSLAMLFRHGPLLNKPASVQPKHLPQA